MAEQKNVDDELELYACRVGRSLFQEIYVFHDGRRDATLTIAWSFYVARRGREVTLIDTGFGHSSWLKDWGINYERTPQELLAQLEITPDDVSCVIITHEHSDHVAELLSFPRAKVVMSRAARDVYLAGRNSNKEFVAGIADVLASPERTHVVDHRETVREDFDFEVVGGHTRGSSAVHVHDRGVHYVLTGDECYLCSNQKEQRHIGVIFGEAQANSDFLTRIADPSIVVLPCHDLSVFGRYAAVSEESLPDIVRVFGPEPG